MVLTKYLSSMQMHMAPVAGIRTRLVDNSDDWQTDQPKEERSSEQSCEKMLILFPFLLMQKVHAQKIYLMHCCQMTIPIELPIPIFLWQ